MTRPPVLGRALDGAVRLFNRNPWTLQRLQLVERENVPFYVEMGFGPIMPTHSLRTSGS